MSDLIKSYLISQNFSFTIYVLLELIECKEFLNPISEPLNKKGHNSGVLK